MYELIIDPIFIHYSVVQQPAGVRVVIADI